jgi:hypothetical protein
MASSELSRKLGREEVSVPLHTESEKVPPPPPTEPEEVSSPSPEKVSPPTPSEVKTPLPEELKSPQRKVAR